MAKQFGNVARSVTFKHDVYDDLCTEAAKEGRTIPNMMNRILADWFQVHKALEIKEKVAEQKQSKGKEQVRVGSVHV